MLCKAIVFEGFLIGTRFYPAGALSPHGGGQEVSPAGEILFSRGEKEPKERQNLRSMTQMYCSAMVLNAAPTSARVALARGLNVPSVLPVHEARADARLERHRAKTAWQLCAALP